MSPNRSIAALDIGTNSTLFLLAEVDARGRIIPLKQEVRTNDLGRGLDAEGRIPAQTVELNLRLLSEFKRIAEAGGAREVRSAATEALRKAVNADAFIERIRREINLNIRIISAAEEAHLTYQGVISGLDSPDREIIVADVGGGSTEIIRGRGAKVLDWTSLPIGAVVLDKKHLRRDPPLPREVATIRKKIQAALAEVSNWGKNKREELIICGGTAATLATVDLKLTSYCPERIAGHIMTLDKVRYFADKFMQCNLLERRKIRGMGYRRAEIILPGTIIIAELLKLWERQFYITSERGLRYGLLLWREGEERIKTDYGKADDFA